MKTLIATLTLAVLLGFTAQAQTVGILAQPNFDQDYTGRGFFAEYTIIKDLGVYADYKFNSNSNVQSKYVSSRRQIDQANIGLSYKVSNNAKVIVSTSIVHQVKHSKSVFNEVDHKVHTDSKTSKLGNTLSVSGLFGVSNTIHGLVGFETNRAFNDNRVTIGLGFSLL